LATLAALISGIVASKSTQLPKIAAKVPDGTTPESRVKRFARWVDNAHITAEGYFVPYAEMLLAHRALQTLVLVIDGSVVGRGCVAAIPAHSLATSAVVAKGISCERFEHPFCLHTTRMAIQMGPKSG
jgi:hypothetical protein